ncbi:MAG: transmembrane protein 147-like [archaeon]|nr:transmembrane protein 147-like [archaeon]
MYALTKMILYATVMPYANDQDQNNILYDLIKVAINSIEILFLNYCLKAKNNFSENENGLKVLCVSLGWCLADYLCLYFFYFIMNAIGDEFTWEYIQTAIQANIDLVEKIGVVSLIESIGRLNTENKVNFHLILILLCRYAFNGLAFKYLDILKKIVDWDYIIAKGGVSLAFGLFCKIVFEMYNKSEDQRAEEEFYREKRRKLK